MTKKEQNMMKLVDYHIIYMGPGRVPKEKKEKLFVEVYNHFNRNKKKKLTKRSDIVAYMSKLRKAAAIRRITKRDRGKLFSTALVAGITCLAFLGLGNRIKRTED